MNLQNGYKVIYEKVADGARTFFADKLDGSAADMIGSPIKIGQYKLIYEKDGQLYGSTSGVPAIGDDCFDDFDKVFKKATAGKEETSNGTNNTESGKEPDKESTKDEGESEMDAGPSYDLPAFDEEDEE